LSPLQCINQIRLVQVTGLRPDGRRTYLGAFSVWPRAITQNTLQETEHSGLHHYEL